MSAHIALSMELSGENLFAAHALLPTGWARDVCCVIDGSGRLASIEPDRRPSADVDSRVGVLVAAPTNLHSHSFQRAMAGMTEARGSMHGDSFWTWRQTMYRFLDTLTPADVEAIAAQVQVEMLEAGYAAVAEFHYLHHAPGGDRYSAVAEMSERVVSAAAQTGIGLTLLPVLYQFGGCDRRPLTRPQSRFGTTPDEYARLFDAARAAVSRLPDDAVIGVAPHSLRAVDDDGLKAAVEIGRGSPLHLHIAEQPAEIDEVLRVKGQRPVQWLLSEHAVGANWCLVHATHMHPEETTQLAESGAVVGLCPVTEANLGDGIFDGVRYIEAKGRFGVGSDSNIRISLAEELRALEYSQRLRFLRRARSWRGPNDRRGGGCSRAWRPAARRRRGGTRGPCGLVCVQICWR